LIKAIYFLLKLGLFNAFNINCVNMITARFRHAHTVDLQLRLREFNRYGLPSRIVYFSLPFDLG